jgi:hypothetical protein
VRRDHPFLRAYLRQIDWVENTVDALGVNRSGLGGASSPANLWSGRLQLERDKTERLGLRAALGERDTNAASVLDETSGDFQETQTDRSELCVPQRIPTRDCGTQVE